MKTIGRFIDAGFRPGSAAPLRRPAEEKQIDIVLVNVEESLLTARTQRTNNPTVAMTEVFFLTRVFELSRFLLVHLVPLFGAPFDSSRRGGDLCTSMELGPGSHRCGAVEPRWNRGGTAVEPREPGLEVVLEVRGCCFAAKQHGGFSGINWSFLEAFIPLCPPLSHMIFIGGGRKGRWRQERSEVAPAGWTVFIPLRWPEAAFLPANTATKPMLRVGCWAVGDSLGLRDVGAIR